MGIKFQKSFLPFYISITFLVILLGIEFISILKINNGFFVYTLDDPYIHLALAENIRHGHYGINANEFSAPSSSILWPFILVPFADFALFPLIFNAAAAVVTVFLFVKILDASIQRNNAAAPYIISAAAVLLILATNIIGIVFTGMEHSLQVLLVVSIVYGLIIEIKENRVPLWLLAAIVLAPLVRYECLAISVVVLIYLVKNRYYRQALIAGALLGICISGFSGYLILSGAGPFSSSIAVKSSVIENGGNLHFIVLNLKQSLFKEQQGLVIIFAAIALLTNGLTSKIRKKKDLAIIAVAAISLHLAVGRFGWYHRYEIYIWTFSLLICFYVWLTDATNYLENRPAIYWWPVLLAAGFLISLAGKPYIDALFTLPLASNNIYEQQYQMHRFAVDYYKRPIAVNDLGYVSYKNKNYVLDLWGLGSNKALQSRRNKGDRDWMEDICRQSDVGLVMIYDSWFKNIPHRWIKIGTLHLGKRGVTAANDRIAFYATSQGALKEITRKLPPFIETLPADVKFTFFK